MEEFKMTNIAIAAAACMFSALLSESINWYLVYRHNDYKKLVQDIADSQIKLDIKKEKQMLAAGAQGLKQ